MARGNERAFLARILRESVLTLCREAMDSHRRFIVDGIVCISLEDDNSGSDCSPIVVTIHEQLPKMCKGDYPTSPQRQNSPPSDGPNSLTCPRPSESETEEGRAKRPEVPLDKKNNILRRVQQAEAENSTGNSVHSPAPPRVTSPCRSASEPLAAKMPGLQEDKEDGHVSDPGPLVVRSLVRHSLSQCSEGSEKGEGGRGSVSSPASSDLSSTPEDVSPVGRAGSASPQDDFSLPVNGFSTSPALVLSRYYRGNLGLHSRREVLHCQRCGHGFPNAFSLERHNRQKHSLFTCTQCLATFATRSSVDSHACLHLTKSARRNSAQLLSRRDYRQRYTAVSQPRVRRRVSERYNFSPFVGKRPGDLKRNILTHLGRCVSSGSRALSYSSRKGYFCSSCAITFADPVSYTAHVKCHSQDPDFHQYRCCYCTAVLENYAAFKLHQQVHALQIQQPAYEFLQYQGRLRDAVHLPTQVGQPGDSAQAEEGRFNGSVRRGLENAHTKEEESKTKEKSGKEDVDQMEHEDSGSGPRQSWCTECQVGFPDENTLLLHITDTHEAIIRGYQPAREASTPHSEASRNHPMDTSHSAAENSSGDEDGNASKTRSEQMEQGDAEDNQTSLPVSLKSFPLRVIPLPLPLDQKAREGGSKNGSLITLVKPSDLIIRAEPYPHDTTSSSSIDLNHFTPESGLDLTISQKRSPMKTAYSLLNGALHSASYVHPSKQKNGVKQEPESDPENISLGETLMSPLHLLLPRDGLPYSVSESSRHSPDLPQNLSMPRNSITASRATPADSAKSVVSLDKVLTAEVPFRARSPVQCPMQDCSEEFPSFSELEEHSARVHRRYLCSYCGKSFTAKPNRDRHVRVHTGVKPYKCQVCGQAFHRGDDLKYHVTTKHPRDTESY